MIDPKKYERMQARIRALLNKTVANGCTEDEAFSAAAKAQELIEEYEIDMTMEMVSEKDIGFIKHICRSAFHMTTLKLFLTTLGKYTNTRIVCPDLPHNRFLYIFGKQMDVELAQFLCSSLSDYVVFAANMFHASNKAKGDDRHGKSVKHAYAIGAGTSIRSRLEKLIEERNVKATTGRELVIQHQDTMIDNLVDKLFRPAKTGKSVVTYTDYKDAVRQGKECGNNAPLSRGVSNNKNSRIA